jgi:hypothetical protein
LIFDTMSKEDSDATDPRLDGGNPTGTAGALARDRGGPIAQVPGRVPHAAADCGFRYPSLCRPIKTARGRLPERPKGAVCKTVG